MVVFFLSTTCHKHDYSLLVVLPVKKSMIILTVAPVRLASDFHLGAAGARWRVTIVS